MIDLDVFGRIADNRDPKSLASKSRRERLRFFSGLLAGVCRPLTILDVGGTQAFWRTLDFAPDGVHIVLLNLEAQPVDSPAFTSIAGDARDLSRFADKSIDVVYSNSVIEHVGTLHDQLRMAAEIRRVSKRYFVQTPNARFLIEPHFLVPGFQMMPVEVRAFLLTRFRLGWFAREKNWQRAREAVESIRLMTRAEFAGAFPQAAIYQERVAGFAKSFVAYDGW